MHYPLLMIGEAYGKEEERAAEPFVGGSGKILRGMLRDMGFLGEYAPHPTVEDQQLWQPTQIYFTNVVNVRPTPTNDIKNLCGPREQGVPGLPRVCENGAQSYLRNEFADHIRRLWEVIEELNPNLIVTLGNTPTSVLTGSQSKITKNRGTITISPHAQRPDGTYYKILPTFHPASLMRDMSMRPIILRDFMKAKSEMRSPVFARPSRQIWLRPNIADMVRFENEILYPRIDERWGIDIETKSGSITEIGFGRPDVAIVVPFFCRDAKDGNYWPDQYQEIQAWRIVERWCGAIKRPTFQNGLYDLNYLMSMGIRLHHEPEDTMLRWHSIQPEMKKGLGFLASLMTQEPAWKFMREEGSFKKEDD